MKITGTGSEQIRNLLFNNSLLKNWVIPIVVVEDVIRNWISIKCIQPISTLMVVKSISYHFTNKQNLS